ncbi:MAG: alpha/beta hydrolase [Thermoanaerobaculia bacterium]
MALRGLAALSPSLASHAAGALFRLPPRRARVEAEARVLANATPERLRSAFGDSVATWRWGGGPAVLLVHGWGSRGGRLACYVPALLEQGYSVVTFDAPGHGASSGRLSSAPQFVKAIAAVADRFGPFAAVIAHSMGGCAVSLAMRDGVRAERVVFIAPSANPGEFSNRFAQVLGLREDVMDRMRRRFEHRFGYRWEDFDVTRFVDRFQSTLLVIHDRDDREVPWSDGAAIARAWPGARLITTNGLGHKRIVEDPEVAAKVLDFLRPQTQAAGAAVI